ncbi:MAG: hypothetical protein K8T20_00655 [Planctomycetes bacterium]|nr:hypothetical protein [Planctomycetota bacterium]
MSHPVTPVQLLLHDAGELDAAEARAVSLHAAGCAECAAQLAELRTLGALVAKGGLPEPQVLRRQRVIAAAFGVSHRRIAWGLALAVAAALLFAVGRAWWPAGRTVPPKPANPWVARHHEALQRLDRRPVELARGPGEPGAGIGSAPIGPEPGDAARAAVAKWEAIAGVRALYPARVPEGMRFRQARVAGDAVEVTFAGGGKSFTVFAGAGDGVERVEGTVVAGTAAGLRFVIVGEGLGAADLKLIRESLERPAPK